MDTHKDKHAKPFLQRIKIDSFGSFSQKVVGPFNPGLNVVFGKNEAGKTTLNAFFGGVMFGWEEARGAKNTYKPKNAERSGTLFFAQEQSGEEFEFSRAKNTEGLQGPEALVDDIDKETYQTMFSLTSDELRSLRNTTDVTAKLLTAGSGTGASPAQALGELQAHIAEFTSKAAGHEHSFVNLNKREEELKEHIAEAQAEALRFKKQDKELRDLEPQSKELRGKLESLHQDIERLAAAKAGLEKLDAQYEKEKTEQDSLQEEESRLTREQRIFDKNEEQAHSIAADQEYVVREKIEHLQETRTRLEHQTTVAKETYGASKARYEALLEADDIQALEVKIRNQRRIQIVLSIVLPLLFASAGIPVFLRGREINSLSISSLGIFLVIFAVVLATAALVMVFRPNKTADALAQKKQDLQHIMLYDKKILESSEAELDDHLQVIYTFLDDAGLQDAQGSLRHARIILDEARERRAQTSMFAQQHQAVIVQLASVEDRLQDIKKQREYLCTSLGLNPDASSATLENLISQKTQQRATLTETSESTNRRCGELKQDLSQAKHMKQLDALRLEYQQVRTLQKESAESYARLLLAKRSLETAISAWESKSQPEVYKQASRLLSLMTGGKWTQIRMTPEGRLQVIDEVKTVREPVHLSLGTCQQMYLSLRIALLMTAENVGRIIPIMADDILVNFDAERREGAAEALCELATKRQVIVFTCHEEIVRLMQSVNSQTNVIKL